MTYRLCARSCAPPTTPQPPQRTPSYKHSVGCTHARCTYPARFLRRKPVIYSTFPLSFTLKQRHCTVPMRGALCPVRAIHADCARILTAPHAADSRHAANDRCCGGVQGRHPGVAHLWLRHLRLRSLSQWVRVLPSLSVCFSSLYFALLLLLSLSFLQRHLQRRSSACYAKVRRCCCAWIPSNFFLFCSSWEVSVAKNRKKRGVQV